MNSLDEESFYFIQIFSYGSSTVSLKRKKYSQYNIAFKQTIKDHQNDRQFSLWSFKRHSLLSTDKIMPLNQLHVCF